MLHLGGPTERERLLEAHRRRAQDPWYFAIVSDQGEEPVGTIGGRTAVSQASMPSHR
jgi:hypothetical protein